MNKQNDYNLYASYYYTSDYYSDDYYYSPDAESISGPSNSSSDTSEANKPTNPTEQVIEVVAELSLSSGTAVFLGDTSAYTFTEVGNTVVVTDSQLGRDGTVTLDSIEQFQFTDGTFQLSELLDVTDVDRGIYRFFNVDTGTHFLSGSTVERDSVINNLDAFNFEGPTFRAADPTNVAADTVFRFFNTQTGTHFFTQSTVERDNILDTLPQFSFEGEAYKGYTEQVDGSIPLYRFFNTQTGTHFYTAAEAEKDSIIENLPTFNFEGTAYWVDPVMG